MIVSAEMDAEIGAYLDEYERSQEEFYASLEALDRGGAGALDGMPHRSAWGLACKLWSAGIEKWGRAWALREYDLREARK